MTQILIIAFAGAIGALSRYALVSSIGLKAFPWATLTVNVVGSLLMGVAYVLIVDKSIISEAYKPFVMTGFLGAFTTFSTFSLEAWQLIDRGDIISAIAYILSSVVLCIVALTVGIALSRIAFS